MTRRLVVRLVASSVCGLAAMNVGCSGSPSSPTPAPASVTSLPPSPAPPVSVALTSVSPSSGPTVGGDYIRAFGSGFTSGATVFVDGAATQVIRVTGTFVEARTLAHVAGAVDVVVMNPDGQTATLKAAYTYASSFALAASPTIVTAGGALTVTFDAPPGRACVGGGDWIAIYRVGDPDETGASNGHSDLWYEHLCGASSGRFTLSAPSQPGTYEFRYLIGDRSVARSNPITIQTS
jgi:hypothetical protein